MQEITLADHPYYAVVLIDDRDRADAALSRLHRPRSIGAGRGRIAV
jgi:hypothetical protein